MIVLNIIEGKQVQKNGDLRLRASNPPPRHPPPPLIRLLAI